MNGARLSPSTAPGGSEGLSKYTAPESHAVTAAISVSNLLLSPPVPSSRVCRHMRERERERERERQRERERERHICIYIYIYVYSGLGFRNPKP